MTDALARMFAARSWLFVPALRAAEWLPKAVASGADAVIVDLEDATAPAQKDAAREAVRILSLPPGSSALIVVRLNAGERSRRDAEAAAAAGADAVMLPKAESAEDVRSGIAGRLPVVALVETARGIANAVQLAATDGVAGLAFGSLDFSADVGATPASDGVELLHARSQLVIAAAAARVPVVDSPWFEVADLAGLDREARAARRLGFTGKLAISPRQVSTINAAFTPTASELEEAQAVLAALEAAEAQGSGIAVHAGRMIDRPMGVAARRLLARAHRADA